MRVKDTLDNTKIIRQELVDDCCDCHWANAVITTDYHRSSNAEIMENRSKGEARDYSINTLGLSPA